MKQSPSFFIKGGLREIMSPPGMAGCCRGVGSVLWLWTKVARGSTEVALRITFFRGGHAWCSLLAVSLRRGGGCSTAMLASLPRLSSAFTRSLFFRGP